MTKKKKESTREMYDKNIRDVNIGDLCTEYMKKFGANNNLMRHIPFLMDGLKPGERRILYTLYNINKGNKYKFRKVDYIVGQVLLYHPHGPAAIGGTLVKMAEYWTNNQCLIDGHGNFGSAMGDPAAAGRYIEAKLSEYAYKCFFEDFDPNVVDMVINYTGDLTEPTCLPSRYPNILVNDAFGIGWGMSSSLPTYNLREAFELTIKLIDNPNYDKVVLIPDSGLGYEIIDEGKYPEICATGKGILKMRGVIEVDEKTNSLLLKSTPIHVSMKSIIEEIVKLSKENKIRGLKKIKNETNKKQVCMRLIFREEIDPIAVRELIYRKTNMRNSLGVNYTVIDDSRYIEFNLRDLILSWIEYRRDFKRRIYNSKIIKCKERQHILETLIFILDANNAEDTLSIIKKAEDESEIVDRLMSRFDMSSLQAKQIARMRMSALTKDARRKYKEEKEEIDISLKELMGIVRSNDKIDEIIKAELREGIELFGKPRQCKLVDPTGEAVISDTKHVLVFTNNNKVKKLSESVEEVGAIDQNDYPTEIFLTSNTKELLLFDTSGKASKLPVHKIDQSDLKHTGTELTKYSKVGKIVSIIPNPSEEEMATLPDNIYYLFITKNGIIKKTPISAFFNIKNELLSMLFKEGDKLQCVKLLMGDKDIVIFTSSGRGLRFNTSELKESARLTKGVMAMKLLEGETILGTDIIAPTDKYIFTLTNKGNAKKSPMNTFPNTERNSNPVKIVGIEEGEELIKVKTIKGNEKFNVYMKGSIEVLDCEDLAELPRLSKGRKTVGVRRGEKIIDVKQKN